MSSRCLSLRAFVAKFYLPCVSGILPFPPSRTAFHFMVSSIVPVKLPVNLPWVPITFFSFSSYVSKNPRGQVWGHYFKVEDGGSGHLSMQTLILQGKGKRLPPVLSVCATWPQRNLQRPCRRPSALETRLQLAPYLSEFKLPNKQTNKQTKF